MLRRSVAVLLVGAEAALQRAAHREVERAVDRQHAVAHLFHRETAPREAREQAILRIGLQRRLRDSRCSSGTRSTAGSAVQRLHRPALLDELLREVIEQLGMRRRLAHLAEVVRRAHQSLRRNASTRRDSRSRARSADGPGGSAIAPARGGRCPGPKSGCPIAGKNQRERLGRILAEAVVVAADEDVLLQRICLLRRRTPCPAPAA